jgi:Xaa-Pro dipeptidase
MRVTREEQQQRVQRLRAAMATSGCDAWLIAGKGHWWTGRGGLRYLTDFHFWGHDGLAILPAEGELGLVLTSPAVGRRVADRGLIEDVRGDFNLVGTVTQMLHERKLGRARIGIVGYDWVMPAGRLAALRADLPAAEFVGADRPFEEVRAVKSPFEIAQAREMWPLMRECMASFVAGLAPGRSRQSAAAEAIRTAHALGARDVLVFIGEDLDDINPPTEAPLRLDGVLRMHLEICGPDGHWCERTVMIAYRDLTPAEEALQAAELEAFAAVRAAARPGVTLREVATVYENALRHAGYENIPPSHHFDVHGQGLDAIEFPRFSSADPEGTHADVPLREGMIFSYHPFRPVAAPGVWGPDIHDNVLVTPQGLERLSGDWDLSIVRAGT